MELHLIEKNLKFDSLVWLHHSLRKCYFCLSRFFVCIALTNNQRLTPYMFLFPT